MFLDKPIFGHGVKMFRYKCEEFAFKPKVNYKNEFGQSKEFYGCSTHPHNIYLKILSETGFIGFLLSLVYLYIYFQNFYYDKKSENFIICFINWNICKFF